MGNKLCFKMNYKINHKSRLIYVIKFNRNNFRKYIEIQSFVSQKKIQKEKLKEKGCKLVKRNSQKRYKTICTLEIWNFTNGSVIGSCMIGDHHVQFWERFEGRLLLPTYCIILVKSEKAANRVLASITKFIEKKLGLKVNAEKSKVTRPTKTKYLGFSFWMSKSGKWKPKPHLKSYQKLIRKLKQLTDRSWSISLDNRIKKINYLIRGWINYFKIANMKKKITEIDEHLRTRIRVIIWKQWKKIRTRCEALQKLGVHLK